MSAADDFIDDMIEHDMRLDMGGYHDMAGGGIGGIVPGIFFASCAAKVRKERFRRFFLTDGKRPEWMDGNGTWRGIDCLGRRHVANIAAKSRRSSGDYLPKVMELPDERPEDVLGAAFSGMRRHEAFEAVLDAELKRRRTHGVRWRRGGQRTGKKRRQTAATVRDAMTVRYRLMRQREQRRETRDEVRAAYAKGAADMRQRAARLVGERLGPAPMPPPCLPEGADYDLSELRARHDPDDWRQRDDVPKELADCERRRAAGAWRPFRADGRDAPRPVDRPAETGA